MAAPYIAKSHASRRRFLRGVGVGMALPLLDCMTPAFGNTAPKIPQRMLLISNNLGVLPDPFFPKNAGSKYTLSPYLEKLKDFRDDFTVFSGLSHPNVSQYAVEHLGQQTRFPTLNLGVNIDRANRSLSWTRDGALLPAEDSPAQLFRRLFVQGSRTEVSQRLHRLKERGSILDALRDDMRRMQKNVGTSDRDRLDQYFTSVRELEDRLHTAGEWEQKAKPKIDREAPKDIPDRAKFFPKLELMLSMAQLALETDSTRIVTLMVDAFATPVFEISQKEKSITGYHNLSHHGQSKEKIGQLEKVDHRQMAMLNDLLRDLSDKPDGDARLLDRTMVLYGSNMGDANVHNNTNLPILLAGGGFRHGQHLAFNRSSNAPLGNLFVAMLQRLGIDTDEFSSATGSLKGLSPAS